MPIVLFYGDNSLEIDESARARREQFNTADVLIFDGATVPLATLSEGCLTAGLFDPERLIIVDGMHQRLKGARKNEAEAEEIERILTNVPPATTVLLLGKEMGSDHPLHFMVRGLGGEVHEHMVPKKGDLARWISIRARSHHTTIERDAADLLAEQIGPNLVMLDSELEKLAIYTNGEGAITSSTVETLVGAVTQESIFALVDAIASGRQQTALRLLEQQSERATSGPIDSALYLIRMLARQMRFLLRIRLGQEAGRSQSQIVSDLKLQRYFASRYFAQSKRLSKERLIRSFEQLAALEFGLKSGQADPTNDLYLLIADLCS